MDERSTPDPEKRVPAPGHLRPRDLVPLGQRARRRRPRWQRILILISGWVCIFLGILGLVLPILQGILFLAIGTYLLSLESARARRWMRLLQLRFPKSARVFDEARARAARIARRIRRIGQKKSGRR